MQPYFYKALHLFQLYCSYCSSFASIQNQVQQFQLHSPLNPKITINKIIEYKKYTVKKSTFKVFPSINICAIKGLLK
jgi:hypothetical protein